MGKTVQDRITGFEGIITGISSYLTGCDQVCITPKSKDDNLKNDSIWLDTSRVVILNKKRFVLSGEDLREESEEKLNGGPQHDAPKGMQ